MLLRQSELGEDGVDVLFDGALGKEEIGRGGCYPGGPEYCSRLVVPVSLFVGGRPCVVTPVLAIGGRHDRLIPGRLVAAAAPQRNWAGVGSVTARCTSPLRAPKKTSAHSR